MGYRETYESWLNNPYFDEATRGGASGDRRDDEKEMRRALLHADLEFGTAGLRGIIGAGTNRMNIYTVRKATQGLANYILQSRAAQAKGVAIAYDSSHMSPEFADEAALLSVRRTELRHMYLNRLRPTPELSFAVRKLRMYSRHQHHGKP